MSQFKLVSDSVKRIADRTFDKKFVLISRVVSNWAEVVGTEMADVCVPVKINHRKSGRGRNVKFSAILDIACSSAVAARMQYRADLIVEKLRHVLGKELVTGIRFVHLPANHILPVRPRKKPRKSLTLDQKSSLSHVLDVVEDDDLKVRLESLGVSMMTDPNR